MPTKAELEQEVTRLQQMLNVREQEHAEFKRNVVEAALEAQRTEGWCIAGVRDTLNDLGLEYPKPKVEGTFTVVFTFSGEPYQAAHDITEGWIESSINGLGGVWLDSDWDNVDIDWSVTDVSYNIIEKD